MSSIKNDKPLRAASKGFYIKAYNIPINVNARYLAHALLSECLFSSACAILSRRG